jgi:hypothetical protein
MDFAAFCSFWETAVNIASFMATPALQHGYGMNTIENDPSAATLFPTLTRHMPPHKKAYKTTTPPSMLGRGKSKCFATNLATSPLQACHNTHSKPTRDVKHEASSIS